MLSHWDSYVGVSWAFRTDPTKTAADFGAAYLPQSVVDRETFEEYVSRLKPLDTPADIGGAVSLDELDPDCGEGGVCPVR